MSLSTKIEIEGLDELIADAKKAGAKVDRLTDAAIQNSGAHIQQIARQNAPHKTGTLQRSIQVEVNNKIGRVYVGEKYGIFHETGTGIYGPSKTPITPKLAKVLAFKSGGNMVFTRRVSGIPKRPFFMPAVEDSSDFIKSQFEEVADTLVKIVGGKL